MSISKLARKGIADIAIFGHGKPIEEVQAELGLAQIRSQLPFDLRNRHL